MKTIKSYFTWLWHVGFRSALFLTLTALRMPRHHRLKFAGWLARKSKDEQIAILIKKLDSKEQALHRTGLELLKLKNKS